VGLMLFFAVVGIFFKALKFPASPLIIACILGNDLEKSFRHTLNLFKGDIGLMSTRPIALVLLAMCVVMIAFPVSRWIKGKRKAIPDSAR
jgi:putative tricarboxylic transport membrane protein